MEPNTSVEDWLRSLGLLTYTEAFIDNGYDDLDICKQIGDEDLDAIGVINSKDRKDILASVKLLRDKGVNAVYFQLEGDETTEHFGQTDREKYRREDLIKKMKDLLKEDNCVLPENNPNAEHDPLDDLAQYYADQLYTYLQDVREVLEYLRDGESNEGPINDVLRSLPKDEAKKSLNTKLIKESRLSKSLNSLESTSIKGKPPKSPKHGIGRIFSGKKSKNNIQQPPKISGPIETAMILASQVRMSDEDRKNLMLKVKHGDITQEEAMNNFLSYEATHTSYSKEQEKAEAKQQKKKRGFFNRGSFKRHSSGHSSDVLAPNNAMGEMERLELMRKIKAGEMTTDEAWDNLRKFGTKRDSKKSPKLNRRSSKSYRDRERMSSSNTHLSSRCSTFYTVGVESDISQSTSNIPSRTGSTDSSPDSTPGLPRKWDRQHGGGSSVEQLHSSGSFESMDSKGNHKNPRLSQKRSPSPLAHNQVRRTLSAKTSSEIPREYKEAQRRSTLSSFADVNESSPPTITLTNERISENSDETNAEPILGKGPPVPPRKSPKLPPNKPLFSHIQNKTSELQEKNEGAQDTSREEKIHENHENSEELQKPKIPGKPTIPTKPTLGKKPPVTAKPQQKLNSPEKNKPNKRATKPDRTTTKRNKTTDDPEKKESSSPLVNGTDNDNSAVLRTKGEVTKEEKVSSRIVPSRPSPLTRVSRYKPLGPDLLEMIETKLTEEGIDFAQEPYTVQDGEWRIPMTLVDRYSCELNSTMRAVVKEMDHIRIEKLNQAHKMATPCDLTTVRFAPDVVGKLTSLVDWLTSLGLPMYIDNLMEAGYDDIHEIPYLSEEHLNYANITNPEHIKRLTRSLENMIPTYEPDPPFGGD